MATNFYGGRTPFNAATGIGAGIRAEDSRQGGTGMVRGMYNRQPQRQRNFSALNQSSPFSNLPIQAMTQNNAYRIPQGVNKQTSYNPNERFGQPIGNPTVRQQTNNTPPNFKNNLLNYLDSAGGKGLTQGLLEASGYHDRPISFGQALAMGMAKSNEYETKAAEQAYREKQDIFLNQLKSQEENRTEKKFNKEMSILDQSILDNDEVKSILKNTKISDFDSDRDYYRSVGNDLLKLGKVAEAKEFMALATPQSITDLRKDIVSANKEEGKTFKTIKDAIVNFQGLESALRGSDGSAAYATMIKFIKGLDDSVVREGEVRSFTNFQGLFNKLKIEYDKAQGKGFPPETKASIANLSNQTFTALIEDYQGYQEQKSTGIYGQLNMSPELIFSGYDTSYLNDILNKSFTEDDFSTQEMYDAYGQLGDVKRKHEDKTDEELQEYIKEAGELEVKHLINLGFINQ